MFRRRCATEQIETCLGVRMNTFSADGIAVSEKKGDGKILFLSRASVELATW